MLESVFGWILSGSLNADATENHAINANARMFCVFLQRIDITTKMMFINFGT